MSARSYHQYPQRLPHQPCLLDMGSSGWNCSTNLPFCGKSPHGQAPCALQDHWSRCAVFFHRAMWVWIKPQTANENISALIQLFNQLRQAGLNLPQSFRTMILLSHLPNNMFTLASTIAQTVAIANFNLETVASRILAEIDLQAMR